MPDALALLAAFDPIAGAGEAAGAYLILDVFTETPLEGNALAVLPDARALTSEEMQRIARELNLSETVFGLPPRDGGDLRIRIFTPSSELPFAGHPVLGCAVALGAALGRESVTLETGIGLVPVALTRSDARTGVGRMSQPVPTWAPYADESALLAALGVERSKLPIEIYTNGPRHVYVALESAEELVALDPDMRALTALGAHLVSCFVGVGASWKTRMFAPALGVPEDPATGSAAGPLAVHLARHGLIAFGDEIEIRQGAEIGRPSLLRARALGSRDRVDHVEVAGSAVVIARGVLAPRP